jgi:hypothetical protein
MLTRIFDIDECLHKRIARTLSDMDELIVIFEDNTWWGLKADRDNLDETAEIYDSTMLKAGVITQEECDAKRAEVQALYARQEEERERQNYLRLKAKFGGT